MHITKVLISIGLMFVINVSVAKQTLFDLPRVEEDAEIKADEFFEQGSYERAFELYLSLAKYGDKYSQYMVSLQYLNGMGVEKDIIQAYGWASLARRSPSPEVKEFYQQVQQTIVEKDKEKAEQVKIELSEEYSDLAIAMKLKRMIKNTIPECTGSRIRGNCSFIRHYCIDGGSQQSLDKCIREVKLRDPKVIRALKHDLARTNKYIEHKLSTAGSVTSKEVEAPEQETTETEEK